METVVDDLVQVMVPRRFLIDVYALIAKLQAEESSSGELLEATEQEGWTEEVLRRFYERSATNMVKALNYLADNPDRWIPGPELAEAIAPGGDNRSTLAGTFSGASRHAKNFFEHRWMFLSEDEKNPSLIKKGWRHVENRPHTAAYRLNNRYVEQIRSYRREA